MNSAVDKGLQKLRRELSRPDAECLGIGAGLPRADADCGEHRALRPDIQWRTVSEWSASPWPDLSPRFILFLPADVSDIVVLFIAILDEDRTVEVLLVIIVPVG
jgi:hypothetical protein